jgi:hypothetical protein
MRKLPTTFLGIADMEYDVRDQGAKYDVQQNIFTQHPIITSS